MSENEDPVMTQSTQQQTDGGENETRGQSRRGTFPTLDTDSVTNALLWGALVVLALFAVMAAFGLYSNVNTAIKVWVNDEYRPLVMAGFNLGVLLAALAGLGLVLRRR